MTLTTWTVAAATSAVAVPVVPLLTGVAPTIGPDWLQYGAFGLLALVLAGWWLAMKEDRQDRRAEHVEHLAALTQHRQAIEALTAAANGHETASVARHGEILRHVDQTAAETRRDIRLSPHSIVAVGDDD